MAKLSVIFFPKNLVFSVCVIFMTPTNALADRADYGIEVKGQANVLAEPDSFSLSIVITEQGRLTDKIRTVVEHKSNLVINIAKQLGIKRQDINSARVSLRVITDDEVIELHGLEVNQKLPNKPKSKVYVGTSSSSQANIKSSNAKPRNFELSRNITVNFSDIKDYDQFLNKIIKIGVSHIYPLAMSISDTDKYYQQALAKAITNAKTKAQRIAVQTGQSLSELVYVKELSSNHYRSQFNSRMMSMTSNITHNSHVGNQAISANVLVKYSIDSE